MVLPKFLESFLPSYDISKMNLQNSHDKKLIIEAILNRGTVKEIKWLFRTYSLRKIKSVLRNPSRGSWDERVLNYWLKIFKIKLKPAIYEMAILELTHNSLKWEKWFDFIKKRAPEETIKLWKDLGFIKNR